MFKKAVRTGSKIKIALTGPAGSGKTLSALLMAKGLGGKIALIDTENNSSAMYDDKIDFDICPIDPPYLSAKYIAAIDYAEKNGYDTLIIDSLSHQWRGEGGILSRKTIKDSIGGNSFTNWKDFSKEHDEFISKILNSKINIIATVRSKSDYVVVENERGKLAPKKVGLAPVQRENIDYEFSIVFDIALNHYASISKDRTGLFDGQCFKIDASTGELIKNWLNSAKQSEPQISKKDELLELSTHIKDDEIKNKILVSLENFSENDYENYKKRMIEIINLQ